LRCADGLWERHPTIEEIAIVSAHDPGAVIYPSVDIYGQVDCRITFVLPDGASTHILATTCAPWSMPLPTSWSRSRPTTMCQ
jgi:hypothetical protein